MGWYDQIYQWRGLTPKNHGFPEPKSIKFNHEVSKLYALKDVSPTDDYLRAIDEHFEFKDQHDESTSESEVPSDEDLWCNEQLENITLEFLTKDNCPSKGQIQESEDSPSTDS